MMQLRESCQLREAVIKNCFFLRKIPEPVDPPIGTFRNKNLNFGKILEFCFALEKMRFNILFHPYSFIVSLTLFVVLVLIIVLHCFCAMVKVFAISCEKIPKR